MCVACQLQSLVVCDLVGILICFNLWGDICVAIIFLYIWYIFIIILPTLLLPSPLFTSTEKIQSYLPLTQAPIVNHTFGFKIYPQLTIVENPDLVIIHYYNTWNPHRFSDTFFCLIFLKSGDVVALESRVNTRGESRNDDDPLPTGVHVLRYLIEAGAVPPS